MIDINEFRKKEQLQSHSFIFFEQGPPYCELGWKAYKSFNHLILETLREFKTVHGVDVYLYEHEIINVEGAFLWGFCFFETDPVKRNKLSKCLNQKINLIMVRFSQFNGRTIIHNHENGFTPDIYWADFYAELILYAEIKLKHVYSPPQKKSYEKEDLDLGQFRKSLTVEEFKKKIKAYNSMSSMEDIQYLSALDGFFTNKSRSNKYLREEFIPIMNFLDIRMIPTSSVLTLGIQHENFDAKITDTETAQEIIIEITMGSPKNDHLLFPIIDQTSFGVFPVKTMDYLKKEKDSLPERIIEVIEKKHKKNYQDQRLLMVVVQPEYTYQNEGYVIEEIIKEVRNSVSLGKGNFQEIIMLCGTKIYNLF